MAFNIFSMSLIWRALLALMLAMSLKFFHRLYQIRSRFRKMAREHDIPMLPHSFLLGHLVPVAKIMMKYPSNATAMYMPAFVARENPELCKDGIVYVDTWPISAPMVAVFHPDMQAQYTQDVSLPKFHKLMDREFTPFTRCKDLVNSEGQYWKTWRSIMNPGFSAKNLLTFAPQMVEETLIFRDWLKDLAKSGEIKSLEQQASKVTIDVIGRAVLGVQLHCQTQYNRFFHTIQTQISWLVTDRSPPNLIREYNPWRVIDVWRNNRFMRSYLLPFISERAQYAHDSKHKTVVDLAMNAYAKEVQGTSDVSKVDPEFAENVVEHLKMFIFAGHDTTASALSFVYHLIWTYPRCLEKMRNEHDAVFGTTPEDAAQMIKDSPQLLNALPYTLACIKETLRMHPPVGTVRTGQPGFFLTHPESGNRYPTDGLMMFACSHASHRNPEFWPEPDKFIPERFLAREGDKLHVRKNAWRPFELGPRGCIGQYLSILEIICILALTVRDLDIISAYDENGPRIFGDLAWQSLRVGEITAHPCQGVPVKVKIREVNGQLPN